MTNIWSLGDDFKHDPWFTEARDYVELRYYALVNRFKKTFDYVTPHKENSETYSYEFASILRDSASAFDSTLKRFIRMGKLEYDDRIYGMLDFLRKYEPQLEYLSLRFLHYGGGLSPFRLDEDRVPFWWTANNKIKHDEIENISQGSLKNALLSLAALGIIVQSMGRRLDLDIFTNFNYPFYKTQADYAADFFEYIQFYPKDYYEDK